MALIKCMECEKTISEYAVACPNCGCPMNIIVEKSKKEIGETVIATKMVVAPDNGLAKYRSLCKIPKEILEQINNEQDKENHDLTECIYNQEKISMLKSAKVRESVYFGTYEQGNDVFNRKEKIEWIILEKKKNRMLLLSKYALDCKLYHTRREAITWEECTLRSWLNRNFLDVAFTEEEKKMIPMVTVPADKHPEYETNSGNATQDKVFLLSINEVYRYFSSDEQGKCKATKYAQNQGLYVDKTTESVWWWLRSPGFTQDRAARVDYDGGLDEDGLIVNDDDNAVRPALWLDLSK